MSKLGEATFKGKSGTVYTFNVYPCDQTFNEISAVYIISKRIKNENDGYNHTVLYVGQTENIPDRFGENFCNHHKGKSFISHQASAICILQQNNEKKRLEIESDLCSYYNPVCND